MSSWYLSFCEEGAQVYCIADQSVGSLCPRRRQTAHWAGKAQESSPSNSTKRTSVRYFFHQPARPTNGQLVEFAQPKTTSHIREPDHSSWCSFLPFPLCSSRKKIPQPLSDLVIYRLVHRAMPTKDTRRPGRVFFYYLILKQTSFMSLSRVCHPGLHSDIAMLRLRTCVQRE